MSDSREPVYCLDPSRDFRVVEASDAFCRHLGYGRERLMAMSPDAWDTAFTKDRLKSLCAGRGAIPLVFESAHRRADGSLVPVEVLASAVLRDGRDLIQCSVREVSTRRVMEEALSDRERAYASLLSNLAGMAYRCKNDAAWTCTFVSDGCRELTGHAVEDLIGNRKVSLGSLIHPEDEQRVWEKCQRSCQ